MYEQRDSKSTDISKKSKMKGLLAILIPSFLGLLYFVFQLLHHENSQIVSLLIITMIYFSLVFSTFKAFLDKDLLQPIVFVNIFVFFIFVARPIQIIWGNAIQNDDHVFYIYNNIHFLGNVNELPFEKSLMIGLLGLLSMYIGYYGTLIKPTGSEILDFDNSPLFKSELGIRNAISWYRFFIFLSALSCTLFFARYGYSTLMGNAGNFSAVGLSFGTIDIIWIQIGTCALIFSFLLRKKMTFPSIIIVTIYMILVAAIAKRVYIVNLLLCLMILSYYVQFNKRVNIRLILIAVVTLISVVLYGSIRSNVIDREISDSVIDNVLSEFSMFDMLLVSLDYENKFGSIYWGGFYYLSIFNGILPSSIWPWKLNQFDQVHTELVFNGLYGGSVPTSIFGSLYFNFTFLGVIIGGYIFGKIFKLVFDKLRKVKTRFAVGLYALFITFVYDIIRVGDIGREFWTLMVYLGVYWIMWWFMKPRNFKNQL